jgi:hypothetical protein
MLEKGPIRNKMIFNEILERNRMELRRICLLLEKQQLIIAANAQLTDDRAFDAAMHRADAYHAQADVIAVPASIWN